MQEVYYLLQSLLKEAKRYVWEAEMLEQVVKETRENAAFDSNIPLTIVGALTIEQCKKILPNEIILQEIVNPFLSSILSDFFQLDQKIEKAQQLLVLNPYLSDLLFLYPSIIRLLSSKIKKKFIFPYYVKKCPFQIEWGENFRGMESKQDIYWRWALNEEADFFINNNSLITKQIIIKADVWFLDEAEKNIIKFYFLNDCFEYVVQYGNQVEFKINVPPGRYRFGLSYNGKGVKQEGWPQTLYFALANLAISVPCEEIELNKEAVYSSSHYLSLHNDKHVRSMLHKNKFFEVDSVIFAKGKVSYPMQTTRFDYLDVFYTYAAAAEVPDDFESNHIWYFAKRTASLRERN